MDKHETIQKLRIITLTLSIVLSVFFIATRIAHCEEGEVIYHPTEIPFNASWDYSPFKDNRQAQQNAKTAIEQAFTAKGWTPDRYFLTFYSMNNGIYTCRVWYNGGRQNSGLYEYGTYLMEDWLSGTSNRSGIIAEQGTISLTSNGELYDNSLPTQPDTNSFQNYFTNNVSTVTLTKGSINRGVPVYMVGYLTDITGNSLNVDTGNVTMVAEEEPAPDWLESALIEVQEKTQIIAGDANQTIDTLSQAQLGNWFQNIIDQIHNSTVWAFNNLQSFFYPFTYNIQKFLQIITDKIQNIVDGFTIFDEIKQILTVIKNAVANDLTAGGIAETWETNFQQSDIYRLVNFGKDVKTALQSLGNVEANAPVITVNMDNTFFGNAGSYTFEFTWYDSIRTPIVTFITAFWLTGLAIHLLTQIPNMIHGVSGTAHGIQGAMPTHTEVWRDNGYAGN